MHIDRLLFFRLLTLAVCSTSLFTGCQTIKSSPKYGFSEGYYRSRLYQKKMKSIYVVPHDDSIKVYSAKKLSKAVDTASAIKIVLPQAQKPADLAAYSFKKGGVDFDVLNILFKLRPSVKNFPTQFNNNVFNGALYAGMRTDIYRIKYKKTPLETYQRLTTHYGYSVGFFTGFGASPVNEYVTQNAVDIQYDGFINISGVCALAAFDNINFGLNLGLDHLFDRNKKFWIYQGKPWIGISVGLNLN